MSEETALDKIRNGAGVMPGFSSVIEGKEEAIMAFLFEKEQNVDAIARDGNAESDQKTQDKQDKQGEYDQYINTTGYVTWTDPSGHPAIKPPWGTLNALNVSTGEYVWQIPLGNNEKLQNDGAPKTGLEGKAGPIVTAGGLVFVSGSLDKKLRAFDKSTGELLWETTLPAANNATPATYQVNGKQYVVLSVGGTEENPSGFVMAFALP